MDQYSLEEYKKIISRRDRRFDGRFFFGVTTTRIYCRPICPAKPKPENIVIFKSSSEAEVRGYRACKRCHPDAMPGSKLLDGTLNTVSRALRLISHSSKYSLSVSFLAHKLGVSERQLRRLFDEHLGSSPIEVILTERLHLAKQLVESTRMPIFDIAFASGFESLRRFNEAFKQRFTISPTQMRTNSNSILESGLELKIPVRLPYDWKSVIAYLKRHECYGLETVINDTFYRFIPNKKNFGQVIVSDKKKGGFLNVKLINVPLEETRFVLSRIKNLFDTEHNPADLFSSQFLQPKGIRVPGSFDPFETAVSIILCQFVSTQHARIKLETLVRKYGKKIGKNMEREVFRFPAPSILSEARIEEIGITKVKANAIKELSKNVLNKTINFESFESFEQISDALLSIKGIGPWTASMILMRCFGNPDAFPKADLIVQRALEQNIVEQAQWVSSRAYLTHCLWRDYSVVLSKKKKKVTR